MVYVRLEQEWTDGGGATHAAGTMVDVDAATLATLEANGFVAEPDGPGAGSENPDGPWADPGSNPDGPWADPGSNPDGPWADPGSADPTG